MDVFIGVDGGGSKTELIAYVPDIERVYRLIGPATNPTRVGWDKALATCEQLVSTALMMVLEVSSATPRVAACAAMAGVDRDAERFRMQEEWLKWLPRLSTIHVCNDAEAAMAAAFADGPGTILVAGTGAIAFRRLKSGTIHRAGGWGYLLGDEGSGYDVGVQVLRAAVRGREGRGPATILWDLVTQHFGVNEIDELIPILYNPAMTHEQIAACSRLAFAAVNDPDRDAVAEELLHRALAEHGLLLRKLDGILTDDEEPLPSVSVTGGLYADGSPLWPMLLSAFPGRDIHRLDRRPAFGSLYMALRGTSYELVEAEHLFSNSEAVSDKHSLIVEE